MAAFDPFLPLAYNLTSRRCAAVRPIQSADMSGGAPERPRADASHLIVEDTDHGVGFHERDDIGRSCAPHNLLRGQHHALAIGKERHSFASQFMEARLGYGTE